MAHLFSLGAQIELVGGFEGYVGGDAFDDGDAGEFQGFYLLRVVGDEADGGDAEEFQHLSGEFEVAAVSLVAEFEVGLDRVAALVLQRVGLELGHETDAAAFLVFIDENAGALGGDEAEREMKLVVAVAAERVEYIPGEALRVDANDGRRGVDIAHDEGDGGLDADGGGGDGVVAGLGIFYGAFKAMDAEVAPTGGEVCFRNLTNGEKRHFPIIRRALDADPGGERESKEMLRASIGGSSYNRRSAATIRLAANLSEGERQMYPEIMVIPMREELARAGVKEARTAADVDTAIAQPGTTMLVVNSICGCAAGKMRPGVRLAMQHTTKPDHAVTVFAGQDRDATDKARSYFGGHPPTSPAIAILRDGQLVYLMQRSAIETSTAPAIAQELARAFDTYCAKTTA